MGGVVHGAAMLQLTMGRPESSVATSALLADVDDADEASPADGARLSATLRSARTTA